MLSNVSTKFNLRRCTIANIDINRNITTAAATMSVHLNNNDEKCLVFSLSFTCKFLYYT